MLPPINFRQWIEENRALLSPPVGNKLIWRDSEFMIMAVGGPNNRTDYHVNVSDEYFYQFEGDMILKVKQGELFKEIPIHQGEMFLLPAMIPHSPQRFASTVGIVIERRRRPEEKDGFEWYCEPCAHLLYSEYLHVSDIEKDMPPVFDRFYSSLAHTTCPHCHAVAKRG